VCLIREQEHDRIKKICGVETLSEIGDGSMQMDYERLEIVRKDVLGGIQKVEE